MIEKKEFSEGDVVVRKKQGENDSRKWIVTKVFKGTLWLKPIINGMVIDDTLYKGVRKGKLKIVGHGEFIRSSAERPQDMIDRDDVLVEIDGKKYIPDSLESVCRWWIATYPEDIFVENPKEVVEIRERMKKLLQQLEKKYNHLSVSSPNPFFVDEVIVLKEAIKDIVSDPETKRRIYNRASELMERRKEDKDFGTLITSLIDKRK